jgi:hypothetical protein
MFLSNSYVKITTWDLMYYNNRPVHLIKNDYENVSEKEPISVDEGATRQALHA